MAGNSISDRENQAKWSFYVPPDVLQCIDLTKGDAGYVQKELCASNPFETAYPWTVQTYYRIKDELRNAVLTSTLPTAGILVAFRGSIPFDYRPPARVLFVCLCGDGTPHPFAHVQVVQNPTQIKNVVEAYHVSHWPLIDVVPRDVRRGDQFENIDYFGDPPNLCAELKSPNWPSFLEALGCKWRARPPAEVRDFRATDAVVAVRSLDSSSHDRKPASKLVNAWRGGVPAVLGPESAYRALRRSDLDFIEVSSYADLCSAITRLRDNPSIRADMAANGLERAREVTTDSVRGEWLSLIRDVILPAYARISRQSGLEHGAFILRRQLRVKMRGLERRLLQNHVR